MTVLDAPATGGRPTRAELVTARAVLDGVPVQGPLLRTRARPEHELLHVLEQARARVVRLTGVLGQAAEDAAPVLR